MRWPDVVAKWVPLLADSPSPSPLPTTAGNVKGGTTNKELDDAFSKYGPVRHVWIARNPPGFAYVEFEDARDAEDAVKRMPGREMRWRVEIAKGGVPSDRRGRYADGMTLEDALKCIKLTLLSPFLTQGPAPLAPAPAPPQPQLRPQT